MFSHMFLLFQSLLLVFLQNCYLLISLHLSRLHGNPISCPISCTLGTPSQYILHAPLCFWHRTRGFLKARHSWELGSSLTTGEFFLFRLLPKVSSANVRWTEHVSYFFSLKNPQTDTFLRDLGLAKLRSTARVWNPQGISKLVIKVDCCLSYDSFLALCSRYSVGLPCYKILFQRDPQRTPAIWHASQSQSQRMRNYIPNSTEAPWM